MLGGTATTSFARFNSDKPYDQFVIEQIAGDELRPEDPEMLVATSFLRMGPWDTAMVPQEEARQLYRDDVVHSIGQSFLSTPMRCCKCHDHKFDPIPTKDYYRMYAALSATQPAEMPAEFSEPKRTAIDLTKVGGSWTDSMPTPMASGKR